MGTELGLRERKKQQTRLAIAATAFGLFAERGFDRVTVAEVARAADVSEATVFNYYPTKEDLVYSRLAAFEADLLEAVRDREPGQSIPGAFRVFILRTGGLLGSKDPEARNKLATISRIIAASPALRARERQIYDDYTRALARLVAEETSAKSDDLEPWVVANALMGVHQGLVDYVRAHALKGTSGSSLARRVRARAERALSLLERGLAGYPGQERSARLSR
jgi:AcrR family transcriptional regulator